MTAVDDANADRHGRIKCGTISVSDLDRSLTLYSNSLQQQVVECGELCTTLAQAWNMPNMAGARYGLLQPPSQKRCFLRLIETPPVPSFAPARTYGWNAFEICVADVFDLAQKLEDSAFEIVGPPKLVDGFTSFIPMQVYGPDGEILFLNQVNHSDEDAELPQAQCDVDQIFIVVLGTRDAQACASSLVKRLRLEQAATHHIRYSLINRAYDLPMTTAHSITMVQNGRTPFAQVDQLPPTATARPRHTGWLAPGNSAVSVMVDRFDDLPLDQQTIAAPVTLRGSLYEGRRVVAMRGEADELIELIEMH